MRGRERQTERETERHWYEREILIRLPPTHVPMGVELQHRFVSWARTELATLWFMGSLFNQERLSHTGQGCFRHLFIPSTWFYFFDCIMHWAKAILKALCPLPAYNSSNTYCNYCVHWRFEILFKNTCKGWNWALIYIPFIKTISNRSKTWI